MNGHNLEGHKHDTQKKLPAEELLFPLARGRESVVQLDFRRGRTIKRDLFRGGAFIATHAVFGAGFQRAVALWSGTSKNRDVSTGPLARPFACSLAPLTRSLAPDCSLRSRSPLRSLVRSLAHFAHSLARGKVNL